MADRIRFLLGDAVEEVAGVDPTMTVLQWLRSRRRTGTKEGCAEGDCGACTVVVGEPEGDRVRYRAVNACIQFLPTLDGKQLITVEDLRAPDGSLHPVQAAMVDAHGSQCGFCTPGFVMSLFALFHEAAAPDDERIHDALAGNLCRCTGYRPILDAARRACAEGGSDRFSAEEGRTLERLRAIRRDGVLELAGEGTRFLAPRTVPELEALLLRHPDAVLLAGGTDVGLWVTKMHRRLDPVIYVGDVEALKRIERKDDRIEIGAGASYAAVLPVLAEVHPDLGVLIRRLGSEQIRNAGTLGGNIANGSPIGDGMPPLIALGATLVLDRGGERREIALEDFYLGYRKTALRPGEFVETVRVPLPPPGRRFATYKLSKRFDQDISAVCAGFALELDGGRVASFRAAYGGMAAVPKRATRLEEALAGRAWTPEGIASALSALDEDFQPLSDMRASRDYRALAAKNLVTRFCLETTGAASTTRVPSHA